MSTFIGNVLKSKTFSCSARKGFVLKEYSGYEVTQMQRRLESAVREQKTIRDTAKASGDNLLVRRCNERIKVYQDKYNQISEITGIAKQPKRMSVPKSKNVLTNSTNNIIMEKSDIQIGKSLGAAAFKDTVLLPNGKKGKIKEGSKITKVVTFAGKGTNNPIKIANWLSKQYKEYNVAPSEWRKSRGDRYVVCDDNITRHSELHWFESEATGRVKMKVKRFFGDES